mmetsp:Transcript_18261/g.20548  ORF Transcript_18261/g.20548 Transcript_18261/m.20548 type:complete len:369 (+) Transcript_18261:129-1235(+)|eukprot:CAMPEP_0195291826 /NCGR_PEP_ID=MMETSP0707-20130614/8345_1 /TAXON_ID=33640 /ORGANISM="Asterionellopsis glacialis, Strain CCMP134" /LENGTH=368 /DNA_ID=CAMNT_0040352179 /DNA_START=76 /DNA_END=1182 /DNA_ORIENTATION=+
MVSLIDCCGGATPLDNLKSNKTDDSDDVILECNYDKDLTLLYQMIEEQVWVTCYEFLTSEPQFGVAAKGEAPRDQAATWVSRYEENGKLRWSQLPLHAAIIFKAPFKVVEAMIKLYPKALKSRDDQEMLPLHLAFRYGASDSVLALILDGYPEAIGVKGHKGKLAHEFSASGPNPRRGEIIQEYIDQMTEGAFVYEKNKEYLEKKKAKSGNSQSSDLERLRSELEAERQKVLALEKEKAEMTYAGMSVEEKKEEDTVYANDMLEQARVSVDNIPAVPVEETAELVEDKKAEDAAEEETAKEEDKTEQEETAKADDEEEEAVEELRDPAPEAPLEVSTTKELDAAPSPTTSPKKKKGFKLFGRKKKSVK